MPISSSDLAGLDQREQGYDRLTLPTDALTLHQDEFNLPADAEIYVYRSSAAQSAWADSDYPLITSYVHCVMDGFSALFGEAGLKRFMDTTEGWHLPLFDDRQEPLYPARS